MATDGNPNMWASTFPASLVPHILNLVLDSWKNFKTNQTDEVKMTQEFFVVLNINQEASKLPFLPDLEIILPNTTGTRQQGRLDLRFIHGYRRKVYFSIECKVLRVTRPSGQVSASYSEYVTKGMFRYFNGQYAQGLDKGGMLGYVMDGNIDKAINGVKKAIEIHRKDLNMSSDGTLRKSFLSSRQVKETSHNYGPTGQFAIYHIFLPMNVTPNNN